MSNERSADRRKHHIIYKTTCKVTGRYYVGMHSTDNLADGYIGSGKRLWQSVRKHGAEQHVCEVLEHLPSRDALRLREKQLVTEELLQDPMCMNLTLGGEGGWDHQNSNSEVQRAKCFRGNAKQRLLKATNPIWAAAASANRTAAMHKRIANGWKPTPPLFTGKTHSDATKLAIGVKNAKRQAGAGNSMAGKRWMCHEGLRLSKPIPADQVQEHQASGWTFGRISPGSSEVERPPYKR